MEHRESCEYVRTGCGRAPVGTARRTPAARNTAVFAVVLGLLLITGCEGRADSSGVSRGSLTSTDGSTGVPECDSYLDQYETCMKSTLTQSVFNQHVQGIRRQRTAWTTLAETAFKKQTLARVCRAAIGTAREEFPSCSWTG
jgi:hypothetical protein